jgi:crotonobetainyl-CoA:carnitine CoA-transferase CaiB-like acyl-CoA transferase
MTKQILEGIKIAEFAWVGVGPQVARELAEHGATVIRVESHTRPDTLRTGGPFRDRIPGIDRSAFGAAYNTNKYGISLNLTKPGGKAVARKLIAWAEGSMKALGLDYEEARKIRPDIIYCSTCQMGQRGPLSKFGGFGELAAAYAGFSHLLGMPDGLPLPVVNAFPDFVAPWYLTMTLVGALLRRCRTGKGTYLDQAQVEAGVTMLGPQMLDYTVNGRVASRDGNHHPRFAPHNVYPCLGDDRWLSIVVADDDEWQRLCGVMGEPTWSREPRFATMPSRKANEAELDGLIGDWTARYPPHRLMALLQEAGVPAGVVQTAEDLFDDPQLKEREHFRFLRHTVIGEHAYHTPAYRLSKTPNRIAKAAPCLGEDNEYVYKEILGYSDAEIAEMMVDGVITTEADLPGASG